jgi:hypothetical protein
MSYNLLKSVSLNSINLSMEYRKILKKIKDLMCKYDFHFYSQVKCEGGIRVIKEYCVCKNCKKQKIFYHKYN